MKYTTRNNKYVDGEWVIVGERSALAAGDFVEVLDEDGHVILEVLIEKGRLTVGDWDLDVQIPPYDVWDLAVENGLAVVLRDMLTAGGHDTTGATLDGDPLPSAAYAPDTPSDESDSDKKYLYSISYADEEGTILDGGMYAADDAVTSTVWGEGEDFHIGLTREGEGWEVTNCNWPKWPVGKFGDVESAVEALAKENGVSMHEI